ncbi:hypothetical protein MKX47_17220 [Solibacillus sp. FSL R7-0668]|uniref:hypothetical protein n=1 Tax=Solibacillus sp. FSL R7-0668 TaxID=2921688 RepID=UPI0030FB597F
MKEYLVQVRDRDNINNLIEYGVVLHVAKLKNIVIMEVEHRMVDLLKSHPNVIEVEQSKKFQLA